jgi:hypothetical protein
MSAVRVIFLVIHIIAAGLWIAQFPISLIFGQVRKKIDPASLATVRMTQENVISALGRIGGIGILISGFALLGSNGWGFLGLGRPTPNWLIAKQVFFIVGFVLVVAVIGTGQRQLRRAGADTEAIMKRLVTTSYLVNAIVLANIVLSVWKPF